MNQHNWGQPPGYAQSRMDEMGGGARDGDDPGGGRRVALMVIALIVAVGILVYVAGKANEDDLSEADASATIAAVLTQQPATR